MSTPVVPARPSRSTDAVSTAKDGMPQVPARPARKIDPSPIRDVRSPLNEIPNPIGRVPPSKSSNLSVEDALERPASVSLPSIGQEGAEYSTYDLLPPEVPGVTNAASADLGMPETTRNIGEDMTLHAPKASLPQSTAKSMIETVTRTDSTQAAAAGIGTARPDDDVHRTPADSTTSLEETLKPSTPQKPGLGRPSSITQHSRPASVYEDFHEPGIPHIGQHIPLNPNAGDVQAPSPGPAQSQYAPGVGFFNDGSQRAHRRTKSGMQQFVPPGGYGLHSHSIEPHDQFERDWYAKNRDKAAMEEQNLYGRPRPEHALSSAELNRIVTRNDDVGMGTTPTMIGTPGEEIGYSASDAYVQRVSPRPSPKVRRPSGRRPSSGSQAAVGSPLRQMTSYPFPKSNTAVEDDDVDVIHIDAPEMQTSKYTGGGVADGAVDFGAHAGNTAQQGGWFVERGPGTPALASDEVLKRHESATMQPAVTPEVHADDEYSAYNSRPSSLRVPSRPGSVHGENYSGGNLHRFISHEDPRQVSTPHTPLEEIEEYEPLIPESESAPKRKPAEVKRRPGLEQHHFPSRDVWEDTPSSMYYSTTVDTAEEERAAASAITSSAAEATSRDIPASEPLTLTKTVSKPHYTTLNRPGAQRFPSKDIWEDTPSSLQFLTTVNTPQMDESRSVLEERPTTSAMPGSQDDAAARATTGMTQLMQPSVPSRPQRRSKLAEEVMEDEVASPPETTRDINTAEEKGPSSPEKGKAPPIPDRPKPTVPQRPARSSQSQSHANGAELTKSISAEAASTDAPAVKMKPVVPARPAGEKIAALKAGFMSDLNNRLKLGPPAPPSKSREIEGAEAEVDAPKEPLVDARKARAKGPARRKPASSASPAAAAGTTFSFADPVHVWSIGRSGALAHGSQSAKQGKDTEPAANIAAVDMAPAPSSTTEPASDTSAAQPELENVLSANEEQHTQRADVEPASAEKVPSPEKVTSPVSLQQAESLGEGERAAMKEKLEQQLAEVGAAPAPEERGDVLGAEAGEEKIESEFMVQDGVENEEGKSSEVAALENKVVDQGEVDAVVAETEGSVAS